jgi:taurine dioxygenase
MSEAAPDPTSAIPDGLRRFGALQPGPRAHVRDESARLAALRFERIRVTPVSPTIGAEIQGAQIAQLDDASFEELHRAWLEYKVIFLRDQECTADQQMAFARRFGALEVHPFLPANASHDEIIRFEKSEGVAGYENLWHSDVSWREVPSLGSVLRCIEAPPRGGDTLFVDMIAAYEGLPEAVRERLQGAVAVHDFMHSFGLALDEAQREEKRKEFPPARHPVVRTHPETGRKILYVNAVFTSHIEGMPREESDALLDFLYRQATVPEYQCRFHWEPGSVAFWDNRAVQHYASTAYWPDRRVMERVTVIGDRPA